MIIYMHFYACSTNQPRSAHQFGLISIHCLNLLSIWRNLCLLATSLAYCDGKGFDPLLSMHRLIFIPCRVHFVDFCHVMHFVLFFMVKSKQFNVLFRSSNFGVSRNFEIESQHYIELHGEWPRKQFRNLCV